MFNRKLIWIIALAGLILLLVSCASETQPLPDIDDAVEEKVTEEMIEIKTLLRNFK